MSNSVASKAPGDLIAQFNALAGFAAFLTGLIDIWPPENLTLQPQSGGRSLAAHICQLRDVEVNDFTVHIRKLLWCEQPELRPHNAGQGDATRPWRIALHEIIQTRLGNVTVLRRTDALAFDRTATLGANTKFSLRDLVRKMREHDVAAMADLFELATACGAWPSGVDKPAL